MKSVTLAALLMFSASAFSEIKYGAGTYPIDSAHSKVGFEIPHLVISSVDGQFNTFEGNVVLAEKFEKSSVKAKVDVNSITTGNAKRDDHLKSPDFFDVKKYPNMTFESTKVEGTPESFKLTGKLTIRGVTKTVTFDSKMLGALPDDGFGNSKVAFTGTTTVKRADYGLTWNKAIEAGPVVGETLTIILKVEAGKPLAKK
jgi:polyisoprenoid-binding protein YceI